MVTYVPLPTTTCPLCGCRTLDLPHHYRLFHQGEEAGQ
jgi:hypothetical protein